MKITKKSLVDFLKTQQLNIKLSFVNRLKIIYRPLICPFEELLELIEVNSNVFDIGCGSGQFCLIVAEFTNCNSVKGIEVKKNLIENAKEIFTSYKENTNNPIRFDFDVYDGVNIPLDIGNYNFVFLIDVIHHIDYDFQEKFLKEIYDKMSEKSFLIIKDIDKASFLVIFNKIHDLILSKEISKELSLTKIFELSKRIGFKIKKYKKIREYWYPHFFVVLEK